jgi:uncharacterized small protein (DUF1192 family)
MKLLLKEIVLVLAIVSAAVAQQSDYAVKKDFEDRYRTLAGRIDSATTIQELDSLKGAIVTLENDFAAHQAFLDKALYPTTLAESVAKLRSHEVLTYDRVYLIRTQGIRMSELEERIALITSRLDSLTTQRDQLFGELQENRKSLNALRDAVKRLSANLQAKDRLVFALADSIFLPYGKDLSQLADVHKEAVAQRIEKANVVTRVYEIAADNVRFLDLTKLQGKDFGNLIDQEQSFKSHWSGLKDNMVAVTATTGMLPASQPAKAASAKGAATKGTGRVEKDARADASQQAAHVDSVLAEWQTKLNTTFWSTLQKEFTDAGIGVAPFSDGPSFSASIRTYVATLKANNQDPVPFTDSVWRDKIDKDWREALSKDTMLGKVEYASLDKLVSELNRETVDLKLILYIVGALVLVFIVWFFVFRSKKKTPEPEPQE